MRTPSRRTMPILIIGALGATVVAYGAEPPVVFTDCHSCGILPYMMAPGMGGGVCAADVDNDGHVDFFAPTDAGQPDQLYYNRGDGTFIEAATEAGLDSTSQARCALWFDYDGDRDLDLIVANDDVNEPSMYRLYEQDRFGFVDVTEQAGLFLPLPASVLGAGVHRGGISAGDINNDGYLDLISCVWDGYPQLFLNNGDCTFTDITASSGITTPEPFSHQAIFYDFDQDGWQDIYIAVDYRWNVLYINQGDNTFIDVAEESGCDNAWNDMGIAMGDYDRDGDFDIYITNITLPGVHNVLYRNDSLPGQLLFTEVSAQLGCAEGGWAWGTTFLDADNDGWVDIAMTNGWTGNLFESDPSRFYWNTGGRNPSFEEAGEAINFNDTHWGSSLIAFDYDRDGDLDLVQTTKNGPLRLLRNDPRYGPVSRSLQNYITILPRMTDGANHFAIGAVVRVTARGVTHQRLITAGTSYLGQEPAEAHIGLGNATRIDLLQIDWPNGTTTTWENVRPNRPYTALNDGCLELLDLRTRR